MIIFRAAVCFISNTVIAFILYIVKSIHLRQLVIFIHNVCESYRFALPLRHVVFQCYAVKCWLSYASPKITSLILSDKYHMCYLKQICESLRESKPTIFKMKLIRPSVSAQSQGVGKRNGARLFVLYNCVTNSDVTVSGSMFYQYL